MSGVTFRAAEQIADAVLYEGYVLYPYRASAAKNRLRWQVGLVTPRDYAVATESDPWFMQTECLAEVRPDAALTVRIRCLHIQERTIETPVSGARVEWQRTDSLIVGTQQYVTWDEAVVSEFQRASQPLRCEPMVASWSWILDETCETEIVRDHTGALAGRIVRRRRPIVADVRLETEPCGAFVRIRIRVENITPCAFRTLDARDGALRQSLASTHTMLAIDNGTFVSLMDPPPAAAALASTCVNTHTFPVLVGPAGAHDAILSSPIILYDYPAIAPESPGDFCDATEIDEMLMLRVRTLTDSEKREARATDSRAAHIIDRCDAASPDAIGHLHGAVRSFESFLNPVDDPAPEAASVDIAGIRVARGSRVRLTPARVVDSIDLCLRGRTAVVDAVYRTLEGQPYVSVTLDVDPFGAEGAKYRRSLFFHPEELVPLEASAS